MTNMTDSKIITYVRALFKKGVELFDRENKAAINVGGAQVYQLSRWKTATSPVVFNNKKFGDVLKEFGATLHSLNRIQIDANGQPVKIVGTTKNRRLDSGLMLYTQYGEDGCLAKDMVTRIVEACPELAGRVAAAVDLVKEVPELQALSQVPVMGPEQGETMNLNKCVILNVSSGSEGSTAYWSYAKKGQTRASIDEATKATGAEVTDLI